MCDILAYLKKNKNKRDYLQKNIEDKKGKKKKSQTFSRNGLWSLRELILSRKKK